ncbi:hypothetical protein [Tumebacillus algifaecis]|uniref:hypothetical protein n=1 Tax=Tumebacillus algifaecis TaxID=1214604 RepID=UPI0012FD3322|nr:hypothetical protein [Tumebacillus algifaecis]
MWKKWITVVCVCMMLYGCAPQAEPSKETTAAKAELVLESEKSVYPYLVFANEGQADAEEVRVYEEKSGQELTALGLTAGDKITPAHKPITLSPGTGVHYQLLTKELRNYTVKWKEDGQEHQVKMLLKEPGRIETH